MKTIKFIPKKKYILAFMISGLFYFSSYAQAVSYTHLTLPTILRV